MRKPDDWRLVEPGAYFDGRGVLHFVDAELLAAHGYPDTPANRRLVREAAEEVFARLGGRALPGEPVGIDPPPPPPRGPRP